MGRETKGSRFFERGRLEIKKTYPTTPDQKSIEERLNDLETEVKYLFTKI